MKTLLKIEIKKALNNKFFYVTIVIATLLTMLSAISNIFAYMKMQGLINESLELYGEMYYNPFLPSDSLFTYWIGGETISLYYSLFFLLIPIFAAFPYGWSYYMETKKGYIKNVITRTDKKKYYISKYIAVFVAGGLAVLIPLLINFMVVSCFVPARMTSVIYDQYINIPPTNMWSQIAYTHPYLYVFMYMILDYVFSGLIAGLCMTVSLFFKNRVVVVLLPFFLMLGLNFANTFSTTWEYSPINFMHATRVINSANGYIILLEALMLFAIGFVITIWRGSKSDVF